VATAIEARPNPAPGACRFHCTLAMAGPVTIDVFDAGGRRVRRLRGGERPAGAWEVPWDGRDDGGELLPRGIYFAQVTGAGDRAGTRVVLAR
jgi:flagellar hook assembly protein FlgD